MISLNPKATYLHVNSDAALNAVPIDLAALGYQPGDMVKLSRLGEFDSGPAPKGSIGLLGVFSSSNVLLPATNLNRVPGAIEAGMDFASACTFFSCQPTDIPQDFAIGAPNGSFTSVCLTIPAGATHLFVGPHDSFFQDNLPVHNPLRNWPRASAEGNRKSCRFNQLSILDAITRQWPALSSSRSHLGVPRTTIYEKLLTRERFVQTPPFCAVG